MKKKLIYILIPIILLCAATIAIIILKISKSSKNSDIPKDAWKVTQYYDLSGSQGSFYALTNRKNELIIIDGGWASNEPAVRAIIGEHNNHVNAWIITHPHQDHVGAFNSIYKNPGNITIDTIYQSPVDYEYVKDKGEKWDDLQVFTEYRQLTKNASNIVSLKRGDKVNILGLEVDVFNSYDQYVIDNSNDITNDSSLMLKITNKKESIIFCGDIKYQMEDTITSLFKNQLSSTYIQAAHHGNWSFSNEFYKNTNAKKIFFDTPSWIFDNPDYPAYELKQYLIQNNIEFVDFSNAPNSIYLQ